MTQEPDVTVIKTSKCPNLSGKSTLTYRLGRNPADDLFIKIAGNTGGGFFNDDWISLSDVQAALEKRSEEPLSAVALYALYRRELIGMSELLEARASLGVDPDKTNPVLV